MTEPSQMSGAAEIAALFSRADGSYRFARWGRPIVPVVFGVDGATLAVVKGLLEHPAFDLRNPNKVFALLNTFGNNHVRFHAADGSGYHFLAEQIARLDRLNPQVAARLTRRFGRWRKFDEARQQHARLALEKLRSLDGLSSDVREIVGRALDQ